MGATNHKTHSGYYCFFFPPVMDQIVFTYKDMIKDKYNIAFMLLLLIFVKQEMEILQIE